MLNDLSFHSESDMQKDVPISSPEIVTPEDISNDNQSLQEENLIDDSIIQKEADLYNDILYTVVPIFHNASLGILPEDQGFNPKYVFLWGNPTSLTNFSTKEWKMVEIRLPENIKHKALTALVGGAYALPYIPNVWDMKELKHVPLYID